jgi:hypothetical protein
MPDLVTLTGSFKHHGAMMRDLQDDGFLIIESSETQLSERLNPR